MSNEIEYEEHRTPDLRPLKVTKDTGTQSGPNMWHLHVKDAEGSWVRVQWIDVRKAERIMGFSLPRYKKDETVSRIQSEDR